MFEKLDKRDFLRAAPLFSALEHNLSIAAAIAGTSKGWIYCDHPPQPRSAFMGTMEGYFLAGDSENEQFNRGVRERISAMMDGDTVRPDTDYLEFEFSHEGWMDHFSDLFQEYEPLAYSSRYYQCKSLALSNWEDLIPPGFSVQPITEGLLHGPKVSLADGRDSHFHPLEWALGFGSINGYQTHGFGFAVLDGDQWASWSMSDCVAENQTEIGIYTMPDYRRKGLGATAVAAVVDHCFKKGIDSIGWHCNDGNTASQRTAEKVGFEHIMTVERHYIVRPAWRHFAELGLRDFHRGEFEACVDKYETVFNLTNDAENYIYHLAALAAAKMGNHKLALSWLREAAERHWGNYEYTMSRTEFEPFRNSPEWEAIIRMMKENGN